MISTHTEYSCIDTTQGSVLRPCKSSHPRTYAETDSGKIHPQPSSSVPGKPCLRPADTIRTFERVIAQNGDSVPVQGYALISPSADSTSPLSEEPQVVRVEEIIGPVGTGSQVDRIAVLLRLCTCDKQNTISPYNMPAVKLTSSVVVTRSSVSDSSHIVLEASYL